MFTILNPPLIPYPLATKSQEVIPHEVAAPAGCYRVALLAGASYVIQNVPKVPIVAVATEGAVYAVFTDETVPPTINNGEMLGGAMVCTPGITTIGKPDKLHLILMNQTQEEIVVYVQLLHTWNILGTSQQVQRI